MVCRSGSVRGKGRCKNNPSDEKLTVELVGLWVLKISKNHGEIIGLSDEIRQNVVVEKKPLT